MPKVTIRRGDAEFEISDLTLEQVKELVGVNGYSPKLSPTKAIGPVAAPEPPSAKRPDFASFFRAISDRGRTFVHLLKLNPNGVDAYDVAKEIGYNDPRQIGGLTGGGLAKIATKYGIRLTDVYPYRDNVPGR